MKNNQNQPYGASAEFAIEQNTANSILNIFEGFRMAPSAIDQYDSVGKQLLFTRLQNFVSQNKTIDFVMLGFPFKSTNDRDKVLGDTPDLGEELTIQNFKNFNNAISEVYKPGVRIDIASDGYVFNDLLNVSENIVEEYKLISQHMAKNIPMNFLDLKDFYTGSGSLSGKRDKLIEQFGISSEKLEQEILFNPDVNTLYRGMSHFMNEELANKDYPSRNQLQKAAKKLTRQMMFANEAYSNLVKHEMSHMIRLSMHPSVNNGAKYSFQLIPGNNARHSAWHCAIVKEQNGTVSTIHKKDAIEAGYELVYINGKPNHFINQN